MVLHREYGSKSLDLAEEISKLRNEIRIKNQEITTLKKRIQIYREIK